MQTSRIQFSPLNTLRITAIAGTISALVYEILSVNTLRLNQHYSFYALVLVALIVGVSVFVLKKSVLTVLKNPDLLVPVGIYISVDYLIGFFGQAAPFIGFQNGRFNWSGLGFSVLFTSILQFASAVCFTGWMTRVLLRFLQTDKVELFHAFDNIKWWFPRTLGAIIIGWIPLYILLFIFIPFYTVRGFGDKSFLLLMIIFIGIFALIWNVLTSAVLSNVLWTATNFVQAVIDGVRLSWKNKEKVIFPIVLLMLASGWITYISATYEIPENPTVFGENTGYTSNVKSNFNIATQFIWTADYPEKSEWHKIMMKTVEEQPLSSVDLRIKIIILFLSLVVNLSVIGAIFGNGKNDIDEFLRFDKFILSNNQIIIPVLAAVAVLFPFELLRQPKLFRAAEESALSKFSDSKIYSGENFFAKNEFFNFGQNTSVVNNAPHLDYVLNLTVLGDKSDVVISGSKSAFVIDKNGHFKEEIIFNLGKQKRSPDKDSTFNKLHVIDVNDDGEYEFIGVADYPYSGVFLNNYGNIIWRYDDAKETISLKDVSVKDVDGDKEKEIIVQDTGILKFFNLNGEEKWSQKTSANFLTEESVFLDADGDGKDEVITKGYRDLKIGKLKDDSSEVLKRPYTRHGYMTDGAAKPLIVFVDRNNLGLFDLSGKLVEKYSAPLSYIEKENFLRSENYSGSPYHVIPIEAHAFKVKLKQDKPEYLAVLVELSTETAASIVDMLYVYDENGEIVYQESFGNTRHLMQKLPLENGTEGLLIQKQNSIWLYKAN